MAKAQDEAQTLASQDGHLKQKLEEMADELLTVKKAKEKAEEDAALKEKMLQKKMEEVVKLEMVVNSSSWLKEKARMEEEISDLQRQLRDATDALECRQTTSSDSRHRDERQQLLEETHSLRQQLKKLITGKASSSKASSEEVVELKRRLEEDEKEIGELKEKVRRYRMQKVNGIQYVDELKEKIAKGEKEMNEMKQKLSTVTDQLRKANEARAELERMYKENKPTKSTITSTAAKKRSEDVKPLNEEPECKQQ
ncbi:hypothetical protein OESDEN_20258 [Oesophagostomum dentatum]|uniref:Uncharacterized protein n=1 Tax=Oesophagostomum dentatum TaxID=61180 RepID=A0A0B1S857_OESDE|nr:hypothetical protein OESDEN_20258 [Oesophagostomum dentatum]